MMNIQQLAQQARASRTTIAAWLAKGLPRAHTKSGGYQFTWQTVRRWRTTNLIPRPSPAAGPSAYV